MRTAQPRASLEAMYQRRDTEPDPDPEGNYWKWGVQSLAAQFVDLAGVELYDAWSDRVWPGNTAIKLTWKQIYQQLNGAIDLLWQGNRNLDTLADAAQYPEESVPGCYGLPD